MARVAGEYQADCPLLCDGKAKDCPACKGQGYVTLVCKACLDKARRHTCGLGDLQDMFRL